MTRPLSMLLPLLLTVGLFAPVAAQVDVTVVPSMTRGPADAPVTIVEFVDFE